MSDVRVTFHTGAPDPIVLDLSPGVAEHVVHQFALTEELTARLLVVRGANPATGERRVLRVRLDQLVAIETPDSADAPDDEAPAA